MPDQTTARQSSAQGPTTFRPGTIADSYAVFCIFEETLADLVRRFGAKGPMSWDDPAALARMWQQRQPLYEHLARSAEHFWVALQGREVIGFSRSILRGEVRQLTGTSLVHERSPVWSPDGKWVLVISDETGEEELYLIEPGPVKGGARKKVQLTKGGTRHIFNPVWSPDSKRIAFADKNLKLWLLELESKKVTMVDSSALWEIYYYSFSPCSKWLAFSKPVQRDRQFYSVFLHDIEKGQTHQVTDVMTNDYEPVFGPDGKYLYFISGRDLKPKLGRFEMSYLYENTDRVYLLTLQADTLSPLAADDVAWVYTNLPSRTNSCTFLQRRGL